MSAGGNEKRRTRRSYRPSVEPMEALRLLSSADPSVFLGITIPHHALTEPVAVPHPSSPLAPGLGQVSGDAWDAALVDAHPADLLPLSSDAAPAVLAPTDGAPDQADLASGLNQLDRYLSRAWYRAAIPTQMHEDCTQAVYATLLQQLGSNRFDHLVAEVGQVGIREVLSRETNEGVDFFRAVDMVKKRAQREKCHQSIESVELPASRADDRIAAWQEALREAIDQSLSPREATLINETLMGRTPAEIAVRMGVAPKTISNEKARVIQKLRGVLLGLDEV